MYINSALRNLFLIFHSASWHWNIFSAILKKIYNLLKIEIILVTINGHLILGCLEIPRDEIRTFLLFYPFHPLLSAHSFSKAIRRIQKLPADLFILFIQFLSTGLYCLIVHSVDKVKDYNISTLSKDYKISNTPSNLLPSLYSYERFRSENVMSTNYVVHI